MRDRRFFWGRTAQLEHWQVSALSVVLDDAEKAAENLSTFLELNDYDHPSVAKAKAALDAAVEHLERAILNPKG